MGKNTSAERLPGRLRSGAVVPPWPLPEPGPADAATQMPLVPTLIGYLIHSGPNNGIVTVGSVYGPCTSNATVTREPLTAVTCPGNDLGCSDCKPCILFSTNRFIERAKGVFCALSAIEGSHKM